MFPSMMNTPQGMKSMKSNVLSRVPILLLLLFLLMENIESSQTQAPTGIPATPMSDVTIHDAVDLWLSDPAMAESMHGHISNWDTSEITNMTGLFADSNFNDDISLWDVFNVGLFVFMFRNNTEFNGNISYWKFEISKTVMSGMFEGATAFNQDLPWDTSQVIFFNRMFAGATSFNGDVSTWRFDTAWSLDMMFHGATSFNQTLCWNVDRSFLTVNGMFCDSPGQLSETCVPRESTRERAQECPVPTSAPAPTDTFTDDDYQSFASNPPVITCSVSIAEALGALTGFMWGTAAALIVVAFFSTFALMRVVNEAKSRRAVIIESILTFLNDVNLVFFLCIAQSKHYNFQDEEGCGTRTTLIQFLAVYGLYVTDFLMDWNALLWSRAYSVHAKSYTSAQFEGLERLHGISTAFPFTVYWLASLIVIEEQIGRLFNGQDQSDFERGMAFAALSAVGIALVVIIAVVPVYLARYDPNFTMIKYCFNPCYVLRLLCYRNEGSRPQIGPYWGSWAGFSTPFALIMLGVAEALISVATESPGEAIPGALLAFIELCRFLTKCFIS